MGVLTLVLTFILGGLTSMQIQERIETDLTSLIVTFCLFVCIFLYLTTSCKYYKQMEYPASEYNINKKIITTEENDVKVDTLYYITRKTK